jgi:hypothetical protein
MLKVLAVLRLIFLIFILAFTLWAMPMQFGLPRDQTVAYNTCALHLVRMQWAAWLALGWIALDTALSWFLAMRAPKLHEKDLPRPGGEPPFAPPSHR